MSDAIVTWLGMSDAMRISRYAAVATLLLLLAAGIAKCYAISRRRNTNAKAAMGLMLLLSAWFVAAVVGQLAQLDNDLRLPLSLSGGLIVLAAAVAGAVLAILGIGEIRANRARYTQGMRQAVAALGLSVAVLGLAGWGVYDGMRRGGGEAEVAALASADQPDMGKTIRHDKFNFAFMMPPKPWVKTDATKLSPDACLSLMRTRPQIGFQIIAEDAVGPLNVDAEGLAEIAVANLASAASESNVVERKPLTVDGIDGVRIVSRATLGGHPFLYVHWVTSHGGFLYQLATCGKPSDEKAVMAAAEEMERSFRLIDRYRKAPDAAGAAAELKSHRSDRYGYSLRLRGGGWMKWQQAAETMPHADFAVQQGDDTVVAAMPIALFGGEPAPEALFDAMLRGATAIDPAQVTDRRPLNHLGMRGYYATFSRFQAFKRYEYRFLVVRSSRFAYLCAGWTSNRGKVKTVEESVMSLVCDAIPPNSLETATLSPTERQRHAVVLNELGLAAFKARQFAQAASLCEKSVELRPDDIVSENVVIAYFEGGQKRDALAAAERALKRNPNHASLRARAAFLLAEAGNEPAAINYYAKLFGQGHTDDAAMSHYIGLLVKGKRVDDAIAEAEKYHRRTKSDRIAADLAILMGMKGEHDRAATLLIAQQRPDKFNAELALGAADQLLRAGRFGESRETIERAINAGEQSAMAYWIRGEAEAGLGRYADAKVSLEAAAAKAPADERIATSIKYVNALLGEGDNSLLKAPIDPVPLPPSLAAVQLDDAAVTKLADGAGGCYLNRATAVSFVKGKERKTTEYRTARVLDASGVEGFNTFTFPFDPLFDRIYVNRLDVRDAAGKVVASGRVADYFVTDEHDAAAGSSGIASQKKVLTVPVPGLKPGHTIDLVVTVADQRPPESMPFTEHVFLAAVPTARSTLFVRGDVGDVRHETSDGLKPSELDSGLAWTVTDLPLFQIESMTAPLLRFTPHVVLGSAGGAWESEARQYHATIAELLKPDPAAAALAKRLTAGLTDDAQRVAALVRHVQQEYAYRAIAFGKRARIPQRCGDVIHSRYGDCKDHSLLLQQLLTAAGFPAQLALVRSDGSPVVKKLPSLDQFDHMIVYAPTIGGSSGSFIDCTDKYGNLTAGAAPYGLAGSEALLVDAKNPRLVPIPPYADGSSSIASSRTATIGADGSVSVAETLTFDGYQAMLVRADLLTRNAKDRTDAVRAIVADPALQVTVGDIQIRELEDRAKPLVLELNYTLKECFASYVGGLSGSIPAIVERLYLLPLATAATGARRTPFRIETPMQFRSTITLKAPDGFTFAQPPLGHKAEERMTRANLTWAKEGKALRGESVVQSSTGVYPAADYAPFEQARKLAVGALEPPLALLRASAPPPAAR